MKIRKMVTNNQILSDLKNHLVKYYGESVKEVILFGSRIKKMSHEFSDYDILIILEKEYTGKDENIILDLCYEIDLKYNIFIDAHIISNKELSSVRGRQPVYLNALKTGLHA